MAKSNLKKKYPVETEMSSFMTKFRLGQEPYLVNEYPQSGSIEHFNSQINHFKNEGHKHNNTFIQYPFTNGFVLEFEKIEDGYSILRVFPSIKETHDRDNFNGLELIIEWHI
jgi:hypothetical protein